MMKLEAELTANKRWEMEMMTSMAVVDSQGTCANTRENMIYLLTRGQNWTCEKDSVIVCVCVFVCVRERERESVCVCRAVLRPSGALGKT